MSVICKLQHLSTEKNMNQIKKNHYITRSYAISPGAYLFRNGGQFHIETSPLICSANQSNIFYMIETLVMKELSMFCGGQEKALS